MRNPYGWQGRGFTHMLEGLQVHVWRWKVHRPRWDREEQPRVPLGHITKDFGRWTGCVTLGARRELHVLDADAGDLRDGLLQLVIWVKGDDHVPGHGCDPRGLLVVELVHNQHSPHTVEEAPIPVRHELHQVVLQLLVLLGLGRLEEGRDRPPQAVINRVLSVPFTVAGRLAQQEMWVFFGVDANGTAKRCIHGNLHQEHALVARQFSWKHTDRGARRQVCSKETAK